MRSITCALIAAALLCGVSARISADALDGVLEVVSATADLDHSVYQLHARIEYPNTPAIREALADGVTLAFEVEARITRDRHLWIDPIVDDATLRRELTYHTVSGRYVVRNAQDGTQQSFATLDEALNFLGNVDGWPILVESQLVPSEHYHVSVRAGMRRGRLPASLRMLLFWTNDWYRATGWFTWKLQK
ncbi:MAG TPA: DUF4390 domain-containing protein [Steroidobacteraceae bacterium]|nr:DUF4390 domain-containing protein [Steroidobacteraceae bacterium]